jgi:L-alanine-DL-glutamate epimerase-like enolase superfamily enzyme
MANSELLREVPRWQREVANFRGIKSLFVLEKNVADLYPCWDPALDDPDPEYDVEFLGLRAVLQRLFCEQAGANAYQLVFYDPIDRFSDPFQIEDILAYVDSLSPGDTAAKAAVDIALHDLVGKLLGQPWWRIWGLDAAKAPSTTFTIGIDTPEVVKAKTQECAGQFNILKVKVGLGTDAEMIRAIREVTDLPLAVDANQGWKDRQAALDEIFWLKENGVVMVEQPMAKERRDDNAWITEHSPIPVYADEAVQRLADIEALKGAYDGINIKLMKSTGMREAWKWQRAPAPRG